MTDYLLGVLVGGLNGIVIGYGIRILWAKYQQHTLEQRLSQQSQQQEQELKEYKKAKEEEAEDIVRQSRKESSEIRQNALRLEERLLKREQELDEKAHQVEQDTHILTKKQEDIDRLRERIQKEYEMLDQERERIAGMTEMQAKQAIMSQVEQNHEKDLFDYSYRLEHERKSTLSEKAKQIMVVAMQRYAQDQVSEVATSRLHLPDEESKGKIIGKEGRNIRSLEQSTGVQVIIDDTPETITLSSFDPIRRQVAKMSIEHLIDDGRIQPSRIEQFVQEAQETIHQHIKESGEQALYEMNITGIDPQLTYVLGRLQFRHSYGQNVLRHSLEVSHLSAALAAELGANVQVAKIAGLFHDVGKALDHELEGSHVEIGRMLLSKYSISEDVIKAMQAHHEEYPYETIESRIVQVADTLSASRPGARKNSAQNYLQRLKELEAVSNAFEGVERSYALNAGREIRVFVTPEEITDFQAQNLARDIALRIEENLQYPGEIKVTLIRETRIIDYAR